MNNELRYDPETDLLHDDLTGEVFFECDRRSGQPLLLSVTGAVWEARLNGWRCWIDWAEESLALPPRMVDQSQRAALTLLTDRSLGWINGLRLGLEHLAAFLPPNVQGWEDLTLDDWNHIWSGFERRYSLYTLRTLYRQVAVDLQDEATRQREAVLRDYKLPGKARYLDRVVSWDPETGAFTNEELEKLMRFLRAPVRDTDSQHAMRILAWLYLHFGKRPVQVMNIRADGMTSVSLNSVTQHFLTVPKAKAQRGQSPELWEITSDLAREIRIFSQRPGVHELQVQFDRLFVWDKDLLNEDGDVTTGKVHYLLSQFMSSAGLTTQRDKNLPPRPLTFNARRARHTVATQLAFGGAPAEQISRVLEHNSPQAAKAYIDAVASPLHLSIDRADRRLGSIFSDLSRVYFIGQVVDDLTDQPLVVPDPEVALLPIGSCGLTGACRKNPFFACYSCSSFLAWRDGDHQKALAFVEATLKAWTNVGENRERSQLVIEFERLHQAIQEVIRRIDQGEA